MKFRDIFMLPVGVHLILKKENSLLLMKRQNTGFADGLWSFPAGKLEGGESLSSAAIREAQEELKLTLREEELHLMGFMHKLEDGPYENISVFFEVHLSSYHTLENNEPDKCSALEFYPLAELPHNRPSYQKFFLDNYTGQMIFLERDERIENRQSIAQAC